MQVEQADFSFPGYHSYWNSADKKGYSGTLVLTKEEPLHVTNGIGSPLYDTEGRVITAEYASFYLVNCYTPNAQKELARIEYRLSWEDIFRRYLRVLDAHKPVILCGDLNVAHTDIDLKNPKTNRTSAGFSEGEREKMTTLLDSGFADSFRRLYPERRDAYTWWSYQYHAREKNAGWRIDYFILSERLMPQVSDHIIHTDILGSDHCPIELQITL